MATAATELTLYERVERSPVVAALDAQSAELVPFLGDPDAVARFRRGVVVAIAKNPDLMNCTPQSLVLACFEAAQQGLEPTGAAGGAHLVPYKMKDGTRVAQLIPDYRGVIRLVTKPGSEVLSIEARVVKEGDEFTYQLGTDAWVNHVPNIGDPERSARATTFAYAIARLKNGSSIPDVEDRAGIERVRKRGASAAQSPWVTDFDEMAKKTLIKRLSKVLPVRPDVRALLVREDELDGNPDADPTVNEPKASRAAELRSRLRGQKNVTPAQDAPSVPDWADPPTDMTDAAGAAAAAATDGETNAAAVGVVSLVERLRTNAEASGLTGPITDPQKKRLGAVLGRPSGLDWSAEVLPVLAAAFGADWAAEGMTASQAQAVIGLADSDGPETFAAAWRGSIPVATE